VSTGADAHRPQSVRAVPFSEALTQEPQSTRIRLGLERTRILRAPNATTNPATSPQPLHNEEQAGAMDFERE
jgi:hypothetical protein